MSWFFPPGLTWPEMKRVFVIRNSYFIQQDFSLMSINSDWVHSCAAIMFGLLFCLGAHAQTSTIEINSVGDGAQWSQASSGQCHTGNLVGGAPECTLRAAIEAANQLNGQINIQFSDIPNTGGTYSAITIGSALPTITSRVEIRGRTHPDWISGLANVNIRGSANAVIQSYNGLIFGPGSNNSRVESIGINLFNDAIVIDGADNITINDSIVGGARASGFVISGNGRDGIRLIGANQTVISNSLIRANGRHGVWLSNGSSSNIIINNRFGVRPFGSTFAPHEDSANGGVGIVVGATAGPDNQLGSFTGNYMANNAEGAIRIFADGQLVVNNRIGVPPAEGIAADFEAQDYANGGEAAIAVWSSNNQIGTASSTGNIIGNADQAGVLLGRVSPTSLVADNNLVAGNRIGLDDNDQPFGLSEGVDVRQGSGNTIRNNIIANNERGIRTRSTSSGTGIRSNQILDNSSEGVFIVGSATVGGDSLAAANVIGGSDRGVFVSSSSGTAIIRNNYIGTNADAENLGNSTGIQVQNNGSLVDIGQAGQGNVIGHSSGTGVFLASGASDVWVQSNYIGVHPNGTPIGNNNGIRISGAQSAFENRIGYRVTDNIAALPFFSSPVAGSRGNLIAHNAARGVWVTGGDDAILNSIRGNRFFANGGRDIDLGMSTTVPGGGNTGPNTQLNWPEFSGKTSFDLATGEASVVIRVRTDAANASYPLLIDLYRVDPLGSEKMTFIESFEYPAASAGEGYTHTFTWPAGLPFSGQLVATASDNIGGPFANPSQFSTPHSFTQGPGTLATATSNNGSGGIYMNLEAISEPLEVTGFDLSFTGAAGTAVDVEVYTRVGSYEGEEENPSAWGLHETVTYQRAGATGFSAADLVGAIQLEPGQVRAVYLQALDNEGIRYAGTINNPAQTSWSNADLSLFSQVATTASQPFGGPWIQERSFAGVIRYQPAEQGDALFSDRFEQ